jgi:hypothetical protein
MPLAKLAVEVSRNDNTGAIGQRVMLTAEQACLHFRWHAIAVEFLLGGDVIGDENSHNINSRKQANRMRDQVTQ